METLFSLGHLVATPAALDVLTRSEILAALGRHVQGDWGDVCAEDRRANNNALVDCTRILSAYRSKGGAKFWIITEADRSATTVLLPDDY